MKDQTKAVIGLGLIAALVAGWGLYDQLSTEQEADDLATSVQDACRRGGPVAEQLGDACNKAADAIDEPTTTTKAAAPPPPAPTVTQVSPVQIPSPYPVPGVSEIVRIPGQPFPVTNTEVTAVPTPAYVTETHVQPPVTETNNQVVTETQQVPVTVTQPGPTVTETDTQTEPPPPPVTETATVTTTPALIDLGN